jgi:uncharacterized protein (TIGR03437 family)
MKVALFFLAIIAVSLSFSSHATVLQTRTVSVGTVNGIAGGSAFVPVTLNALGNENSISFTLTYDSAILSAPFVSLGAGASGADITTSTGDGTIDITVDYADDATTFAAGAQSLVTVRFAVAAGAPAGMTDVTISNVLANGTIATDGVSGAVNVVIPNPTPTLTSINPSSAPAGSAGFNLIVTGTNFITSSRVRWNGSVRNTAFVTSTQLLAVIPAEDLLVEGTASVTVMTPSPGGGTTAPRFFTIGTALSTITGINPSSGTVGSGDLSITVTGTGFMNTSVVRFNGIDLSTSFGSETQLTATIPASNFTATGSANIFVFTPGAGQSNTVPFPIVNAVPAIASLSPASAAVGGPAFTLTVNGTGFVDGSKVQWNGTDRDTTFVSSTRLTAAIPATDIATRGTASITVVSPEPGGGTSSPVSFSIGDPAQAPALLSLDPRTAAAGGPAFTLTVTGTNFTSASIVRWNDTDRPTTFISATQITAAIPATDIATRGMASVKVFTPAPGGGTSNTLTFVIADSVLTTVSAASYSPDSILANGSIAAGFGVGLATSQASAPPGATLPTTLGGSTIKVTDSAGAERAAGMYFIRADQVNFQIPDETAVGQALVTLTSSDGKIAAGAIDVTNLAPGIFSANSDGNGAAAAVILRVKADQTQVYESMVQPDTTNPGKLTTAPVDVSVTGEQVFLILYGTGFRNNSGLPGVSATLGGVASTFINYAKNAPGFVALDQCNVLIPPSLKGRGEIDVRMTVDGKTANTVKLRIK